MLARIVSLAIGYLCGSFLAADVVARRLAGASAFELGDGNPGMANIGHELGKRAALLVLAGDIGKTALAVVAARMLFPELGPLATAWAGLGATLGHCFPFWHRFKGGKGVACISALVILLAPLWGAVAGLVGVVAIVLTGYLSAGAVIAMGFYAAASFFVLPRECFFIALALLALTLYSHGSKLLGIANGTTKQAGLARKVRDKLHR